MINVLYQDQKYPIHTSIVTSELTIPFPEAYDPYLPGSLAYDFRNQGESYGYMDVELDQIDGVVWPEAHSAAFLSNMLQQWSSSGTNPPSVSIQNSEMIMRHTISLLANKRTAGVGTNFMSLQPTHCFEAKLTGSQSPEETQSAWAPCWS